MITFNNLGSFGRLGNQMFQYAALKGLASKNNYAVKIPDISKMEWHGQKCLLTEFNIKAELLNYNDLCSINNYYEEPKWDDCDFNFFNLPDNLNINGYFQSLYYFEHITKEIKKELTPKEKHINEANKYLQFLKTKHKCDIVSVHVRRGDNINDQQISLGKAYNQNNIYEKYFLKAKEIFKNKNVKFLIFTGGARGNENNQKDIEWCKKFFSGDEFLFSENAAQIEDFSRIMFCDHNILSHVSSFGWWAAFMNPKNDKITVAPEFYHPDAPNLKRYRFYPEEYILL